MYKVGIYAIEDTPRLRYTIDFLDQHPLCQAAGISFHYPATAGSYQLRIGYTAEVIGTDLDFIIPAQQLFFAPDQQPGPFFPNVYQYLEETIYSVEKTEHPAVQPLVTEGRLQFDLLEAIFFHISRYEEVFAPAAAIDESGWLQEDRHFLVQHRLEKQAVVDQLITVFLAVLSGKKGQMPTTYDLSHDLDFLFRYPNAMALVRALAGSAMRGEGPDMIRQHIRQYRAIRKGQGKDPFDCFDWLLASDANWTQKTLYLMAGGETAYDNHYRLEDPKVAEILRLARARDYTLGLHPSYNAAQKTELYRREMEKLETGTGQKISRNRQHWLRFDWQITPHLLTRMGILEDASIGYRRRLGFRCGTGFPFHLYNFEAESAFAWRERPLTCMESAAIHEAANTGKSLTLLFQHFFQQNASNTHISINFHNSNFDPSLPYGRELSTFYQQVILALPNYTDA